MKNARIWRQVEISDHVRRSLVQFCTTPRLGIRSRFIFHQPIKHQFAVSSFIKPKLRRVRASPRPLSPLHLYSSYRERRRAAQDGFEPITAISWILSCEQQHEDCFFAKVALWQCRLDTFPVDTLGYGRRAGCDGHMAREDQGERLTRMALLPKAPGSPMHSAV
jgi:hypothetical protein